MNLTVATQTLTVAVISTLLVSTLFAAIAYAASPIGVTEMRSEISNFMLRPLAISDSHEETCDQICKLP